MIPPDEGSSGAHRHPVQAATSSLRLKRSFYQLLGTHYQGNALPIPPGGATIPPMDSIRIGINLDFVRPFLAVS